MSVLAKIKRFVIVDFLNNYKYDSKSYVSYLRGKGVKIGENVHFNQTEGVTIDVTRPSLVEIGNNVRITKGFTLLTHDYSWFVLRNVYNDVNASSGRVKIGNNVFIGFNSTVLNNIEIGDNCIIAAGSVVTKSVPNNSVVAGVPAKVISTLDDFYEKRKSNCICEAFQYANSIRERYGREPVMQDFWEEFPLFLDGDERPQELRGTIIKQLGPIEEAYIEQHKKTFPNFATFLNASKSQK